MEVIGVGKTWGYPVRIAFSLLPKVRGQKGNPGGTPDGKQGQVSLLDVGSWPGDQTEPW